MNGNIKAWYTKTYPTDELGEELDDSKTFNDAFNALDLHRDIYNELGIGDSLVRERLFEELAKRMEVDYDYIYNQWLAA